MIDMGFESQVNTILDAMPSSILKPQNYHDKLHPQMVHRITYMFTATMSSTIERPAQKYLQNSITVTIGHTSKVTNHLTQHVIMVKEANKLDR